MKPPPSKPKRKYKFFALCSTASCHYSYTGPEIKIYIDLFNRDDANRASVYIADSKGFLLSSGKTAYILLSHKEARNLTDDHIDLLIFRILGSEEQIREWDPFSGGQSIVI